MTHSTNLWRKTSFLAAAGGFAFWVTNFAISRTFVAADYRAALSIPYVPMLIEASLGGLLIGLCVSYLLLRYFDKLPAKSPILKSVILSCFVLVLVTVLIEAPGKFLTGPEHAARYFLIGAAFNGLRILALGLCIGLLFKKVR